MLAEAGVLGDLCSVYTLEPQPYGNLISEQRTIDDVQTACWYHFDALGSTTFLSESPFTPPLVFGLMHYEACGRPFGAQAGDLHRSPQKEPPNRPTRLRRMS